MGRCTCLIVKEQSPEGLRDGSVYSLYTHVSDDMMLSQSYKVSDSFLQVLNDNIIIIQEGRGRKDRKLAVAYHRRRNGKSVFRVAQNVKGLLCTSDESYVGSVTANLIGSKYYIWDKVLVH